MQAIGKISHINIPVDREVKSGAKRRAFLYFAMTAFVGMWAGTEILALMLHFHRVLADQKMFEYVYNPWALLWPWGRFLLIEWPASIAHTVQMALGLAWLVFIIGLVVGVVVYRRVYKNHIDDAPRAHDYEGSSHWATPTEVGGIGLEDGTTVLPPTHWAVAKAAKLYNKKMKSRRVSAKILEIDEWKKRPGIFLGEYVDPKTNQRYWLTDKSNRHVGLYAPTRGGKGVGVVIPAALSWSESMVVNDPKGELFEVTSWYRKHKLGQNIFKFDPLETKGASVRINVLDFVRLGTEHESTDAANIAKMICDPQGLGLDTGSDSDHWRKTAYAFLTGVILHVLYARDIPAARKNLTGVDEFLSNPNEIMTKTLNRMIAYEHDPEMKRGWTKITGHLTKTNPTVAMAAKDMIDRPEGERGSVMSSVKSYFELYRNPIVARNIATSDFSFEDLMYNKKAATLYLINYPKDMEILRPLMRLVVNSIMTTFTGQIEFEKGRPKKKHKHEMLMLMDEFTSTLGKMSIFANAISFVAGYGIKVLIVVQDLVQLADCYGDKGAQALTSNLHTQIIYATNNSDTAQQISRMLGNQTIRQETRSWNGGKASRSESFRGRALLDASEVQAMPPTDEIVMVTGQPPIYCNKITYYAEDAFKVRYEGKESVKTSDRLPREEQEFYKALQEDLKEAEVYAKQRIAEAESMVAVTGPAPTAKMANIMFEDIMNEGTEDQPDGDSDFLNGLI